MIIYFSRIVVVNLHKMYLIRHDLARNFMIYIFEGDWGWGYFSEGGVSMIFFDSEHTREGYLKGTFFLSVCMSLLNHLLGPSWAEVDRKYPPHEYLPDLLESPSSRIVCFTTTFIMMKKLFVQKCNEPLQVFWSCSCCENYVWKIDL